MSLASQPEVERAPLVSPGIRAMTPSRAALAAELVPRELYPRASAWRSAAWQLAAVVGPALGGLLYGFGSARLAYGVAVSLFLVAVVCLAQVHRVVMAPVGETESVWESLGGGVRFVLNQPIVLGALTLDMNDVYRVGAEGGTPMPVSADRYANEYWAAPAPNGGAIAITARGTTSGQWWRNGRSHLDESEIWILRDASAMT